MPEFFMTKTLAQELVPDDDEARAYLKRLKAGDSVLVSVRKPRNLFFHRKWWALINTVFDNQDVYDNKEAMRKEIIMRAGFWVEHVHVTGTISYTAKSISFASMDELEFADLYDKSIDVILKYFMPGTDEAELRKVVEDEVLRFAA